jgi:hypothetical protein
LDVAVVEQDGRQPILPVGGLVGVIVKLQGRLKLLEVSVALEKGWG